MDLRNNSFDKRQKFKRNPRFYQLGSAWFFNTREGKHMGPYDSEVIAELEFIKFIRVMTKIEINRSKNNPRVA